ncbi:MAG: dephospho-CoA kinase [Chitinispirillales bacterium]|jgi:dephospho-CoA kinase|nr:dephospho-CoA kinase [Chitinispirillales bacterium]
MKKVFRIALAGYMGAGKSTCARSFASENTLIIDADAEAKRIMAHSRAIREALRAAFGETVVGADGRIRSDALGHAAFESVDTLLTLNAITHPPLVEHLGAVVSGCQKPLCVLDAALIPLLGIEPWFDLRVWVDAPFETRLARLAAKRPDMGEAELAGRMRMQEAVMPAPKGGGWATVGDGECRGYVVEALNRFWGPSLYNFITAL